MTVSKQSAVNAGEKTRTFFIPLAGNDFNTSSENGSSQLFVKRDWNVTSYFSLGRDNFSAISLDVS